MDFNLLMTIWNYVIVLLNYSRTISENNLLGYKEHLISDTFLVYGYVVDSGDSKNILFSKSLKTLIPSAFSFSFFKIHISLDIV